MLDDSVAEFAQLMQDAALDPAQWEPALNAVNRFVGGTGVVLLSVKARQRFAPASTDVTEMIEEYFQKGWYLNDPREACVSLLKANGVVFDHEYASNAQIEGCDFYQDFLMRYGRKWFAGVGVEIDGDHWCLSLQRSPAAGPFGPADMQRLRLLRGVLANTALLSERIGRSWIEGLQQALHLNPQPALLLDSEARILDLNDAAVSIVRPFISKERHLQLAHVQATAAFYGLIDEVLKMLEGFPRAEAVRDIPLGDKSYRCRAINLLGHKGLIATSAGVLVFMEPISVGPGRTMQTRFGLTKTETKVSMALAEGKSVQEIAFDGRVTANTVRTHLKSIYAKTDVSRQSQLVALVQRVAVPEP